MQKEKNNNKPKKKKQATKKAKIHGIKTSYPEAIETAWNNMARINGNFSFRRVTGF